MLKQILTLIVLTSGLVACDIRKQDRQAAEAKKENEAAMKNSTMVQMIDSVYNFGSIVEGDKVETSYRFKNIGSYPLVVLTASASCGCTVPEKPEKPVQPGEIGFLKVVFNSSGKGGDHVDKKIRITSNAKPEFPELTLDGDVKKN